MDTVQIIIPDYMIIMIIMMRGRRGLVLYDLRLMEEMEIDENRLEDPDLQEGPEVQKVLLEEALLEEALLEEVQQNYLTTEMMKME